MSRGAKIALVAGATALLVMFVLSKLERDDAPDAAMTLAEELDDHARLKQIAMYAALRINVPLTKGGQLDVYRIVLEAEPDEKAVVDLCFSSRARSGPTIEEIKAGDYKRFPYVRVSGKFKMRDADRTALLWDASPQPRSRRLVALDNGSVATVEEAEFDAFLESHAR